VMVEDMVRIDDQLIDHDPEYERTWKSSFPNANEVFCRQRPARVPLSPISPGTRDPPGGAETDLRAARWREVGVGHLPRRWRQRGAEGSFPDRLGVVRDCSACSLSRRG
jgi:hypothetical protein